MSERTASHLSKYKLSLSPLDIYNHEFDKQLRGYNEDQVNEYLDIIIKDYERFVVILKELEGKIETLEAQVQERHVESRIEPEDPLSQMQRRLSDLELQVFGERRDGKKW
jgi:DivIVA domain-containing protein